MTLFAFLPRRILPGICLGLLTLAAALSLQAKTATWLPVTPDERAATDCAYLPGVAAEVLFIRQELDASGDSEWTNVYRRIKIYNAKGADDLGVLSIEYASDEKVWGASARVMKPDGTAKEYVQADFAESVAAKTKSVKVKKLTLAVPALEPGDIVDFRWSAGITSGDYYYVSWYAQQPDLPVGKYTFSVKNSAHDVRLSWFNCTNEAKNKPGEIRLELNHLLPYVAEPYSPPEKDVRSWFMLLYTDRALRWYSTADVWQNISNYIEEDFRFTIKPDATIKAKAAELTAGAATPGEKIERLYRFCQAKISNNDYFSSAEQQAAKERQENGKDQSPKQTLARGNGTTKQINELFASLARAAGFEVAMGKSASRYYTLRVQGETGWLFVNDDLICVKQDGGWGKYAPGDYDVTCGMLHESNEAAATLICTQDKIVWDINGVAPAERSPVVRTGHFTLDAEGNLEGDVEVSVDGHVARNRRAEQRGKQQQEIDADYLATITKHLPAAEITELTWENADHNTAPLIARYKLKVAAYADVVGSKIILPTNVFLHNVDPVFTSDTRQAAIFFPYLWTETDQISITLPEGYLLDAPSSPRNIGKPADPVSASYTMAYQPKIRTMTYKRNLIVGGGGVSAFQAGGYAVLKKMFDGVKRSDEHTIVLKPKPPADAPPAAAGTP